MLRKILNFRVLYRATPLFSFAIHTKYPKINHSPLRGSICSEIKSILHMKKGGQYLPECQLCDIQKLMIFVSKWGVSLVRNIHTKEDYETRQSKGGAVEHKEGAVEHND